MRFSLAMTFASLALLTFSVGGCGGSAEKSSADSAPFEKAINAYLEKGHMDMKVSKFKNLKIEGDKASAVCAMKDAGGMYAMAVEWTFAFEKKDGGWIVSEVKK